MRAVAPPATPSIPEKPRFARDPRKWGRRRGPNQQKQRSAIIASIAYDGSLVVRSCPLTKAACSRGPTAAYIQRRARAPKGSRGGEMVQGGGPSLRTVPARSHCEV